MPPWGRKSQTSEQSGALVPMQSSRSVSPDRNGMMGASSMASPQAASIPQNLGQVTNSKRQKASVVEMLEYVKELDIDPIKDADMLWIAEEAFNAALPPGWSEHQDEEGRVYFHNGATGESVWRHPMDDLFKEIVEYQRTVARTGGFHAVEDEIAELEENIRRDLADWMELFDEHGEKFFYNRKTDDSRFDDPRMAVYHKLYARIKMVAKMKEKLPVLARAPRPEEPTMQEQELRRRQKEAEETYLKCLVKLQSFGRQILAKRHFRNLQAKATVQKGPQPLRGKFRLKMDKVGTNGRQELVLAMTTPHKRHRAAMKIQAQMRGVLTRKRLKPLIVHRRFVSKIVTKLQARARVWLAKRAAVRRKHERVEDAAVHIQRCWRGFVDRKYMSTLRGQRARYVHYMDSVRFIQKRARIMLERKKLKAKHLARKTRLVQMIKSLARKGFARDMMAIIEMESHHTAATRIQSVARGKSGRKRVKYLRSVANVCIQDALNCVWQEVNARIKAAARMQGSIRMQETQKQGLLAKKRLEFMERIGTQIQTTQFFVKKYSEQWGIMQDMADERLHSAIVLQAAWRGTMVRNRLAGRVKEAPVVIKGTFEYTSNRPEGCSVEVKFAPSASFDGYKYIVENGRPAVVALGSAMQELHGKMKSSVKQIHDLLDGVTEDPFDPESGPADKPTASQLQREEERAAAEAAALQGRSPSKVKASASRPGSKDTGKAAPARAAGSKEPPKAAGSKEPPRAAAGSKDPPRPAASKDVAPAAAATAQGGAAAAQTASGRAAAKPDDVAQGATARSGAASSRLQSERAGASPSAGEAGGEEQLPVAPAGEQEDAAPEGARKPKQKQGHSSPPRRKIEVTSEAHGFLMDAMSTYYDKKPPPHPDDPPRPPAAKTVASPPPPPADPSAAKVQGLRTSQSEGALAASGAAPVRKHYGGTLKDGKFVRTNAETVDELSEQDRNAIIEDIERKKAEQDAIIKEKAKKHKQRKKDEEMSKTERFKAQRDEVEKQEEERRRKKAKEMKAWLKAKEDEARAKKAKQNEVIENIVAKQKEKAEALKKLDQQRAEERERRIKIAEKQKAKIVYQIMLERQARMGSPKRAEAPAAARRGADPHRLVHRHVHHHLHFHDDEEGADSGGEYQYASEEERRQMEYETEARMKLQGEEATAYGSLPPIDANCETPKRKRANSTGQLLNYDDAMRMSHTQQAFKRAPLPRLQNFQSGLQKAMGSYADSGRPRRLLHGGAGGVHY